MDAAIGTIGAFDTSSNTGRKSGPGLGYPIDDTYPWRLRSCATPTTSDKALSSELTKTTRTEDTPPPISGM